MGRLSSRLLGAAAASGLLLGLLGVAPVAAEDGPAPATFGTPTATSTFGTRIDFSQPITTTAAVGRVELLLTVADAIGPNVVDIPDSPPAGSSTLTYTLATSGNDHMVPNTPIVARWRVYAADQTAFALGPELRFVYADDRFQWQTAAGALVRVHWYDGDATFGAKALKLGEDEVKATSKLLGVTETQPVDFFVYADQTVFYDALGPGTHENVAGTAFPEIRTLLGLIPPDQIDDPQVAVRIPHEFVHLVFDTASKNPYHFPPRWLNEGLAVYQSEGYGSQDRGLVSDAADSGTLLPLGGLTGEFPNGDNFFLAYAESVSAVKFMIDTYGSDALVSLIRSYADGRTDDEAFKAALGLDMTAFNKAWSDANKATVLAKTGPQPAPLGPVPSAWLGSAGGGTAGSTPPGGAGASGAPAAPGSSGASAGTGGTSTAAADQGASLVIAVVIIVGLIVVVALVVADRRRRATGERS